MAENHTLTRPEAAGDAVAAADPSSPDRRPNDRSSDRPTYRPAVDVYESEDQFVLIADVPGAGEGDIDLTVDKDVLTLHAAVAETPRDGYRPRHRGYGVGDWRRSFKLSDAVDREGIDAAIKDGVLRVTFPKAKASLRKKVEVRRQA